jgi:hypothetical protein
VWLRKATKDRKIEKANIKMTERHMKAEGQEMETRQITEENGYLL